MAWFLNSYRHLSCGMEWDDTWSSTCNNRCPRCSREIEPYESTDLSIIIKKGTSECDWIVIVSAADAEDAPAYSIVRFRTKERALAYAAEVDGFDASEHYVDDSGCTIDALTTVTAKSVHFDIEKIWVELSDGRTLGVPLPWFPRLLHATPEQRERVEVGRVSLHWEELDEDISIEGLLAGRADQTRLGRASSSL